MAEASLIIRGGTLVDGTGSAPFEADLVISGGRITAIGKKLTVPRGTPELDARGHLVTPGFVDIHTHYDAQATWTSEILSSSLHGVTTALLGNCGVGFAPCRPEARDMLVKLMEGVEDLPEVVLTEGLPWNWESFPEYLNALESRPYDMDIATQVPHAALRVHVMGRRGFEREPATAEDRAEMARLAREGIAAGALGFSTSRAIAHKTLAGEPTPTLGAAEIELAEIAAGLGGGWMQLISDFDDPAEEEWERLMRIARLAGRPMTFSLLQRESRPDFWRWILQQVSAANAEGIQVTGQVMGRPVGLMFGWELSQHPFLTRAGFREVAHLPIAERVAALRDPDRRARILAEPTEPALRARLNNYARIYKLTPDYEPPPEASVLEQAKRLGRDPEDLCYEWMLEEEGRAILNRPLLNYADGNLDAIREMVTHPHTLMGLGDGGAHVGYICDASAPTHMLTHWARDRARGGRLPVEFVVKRLAADNAAALGLHDRGRLRPGLRADLNVIDFDNLAIERPNMRYDLPAGGKRLVQGARGYRATLCAGEIVHENGAATGALPGRLIRGAKA
ncbi:amidohydrolase family protein [Roseococcus sp. SDR]|uniref:N-acyl-D-amino-acid deacylase family protein n=1 Tax=Roseococcus sp. SDR TaxID=2835532 RepID=UPI001BD01EAA|nr:amidohydrolase family protein [Roseococcus sp. SDR]MBS7791374.1 amidohydrolase family protein [Roseococcus sp. SDR]MBV1846688.1 amidohydrolase family protein [Roseococcus sp. SDR]